MKLDHSEKSKPRLLYFFNQKPNAEITLFCLHYAGGSALMFRDWPRYFPPKVAICGVQLPGRLGDKHSPYASMREASEAIAEAIMPYLDKPFAFFGHSMGALAAFDLSCTLSDAPDMKQPVCLFASAGRPPNSPYPEPLMHKASPHELLQWLEEVGSLPKEVANDQQMFALVRQTIQSDFKLCETYDHTKAPVLNTPIFTYLGREDSHLDTELMAGWGELTRADFSLELFDGGHFYTEHNKAALSRNIYRKLSSLLDKADEP